MSETNRTLVPKGHPIVAQRFSVGRGSRGDQVPEGRQSGTFRPSLWDLESDTALPNVETLGYSQTSLRDVREILETAAYR
jgi:hypothetical protein